MAEETPTTPTKSRPKKDPPGSKKKVKRQDSRKRLLESRLLRLTPSQQDLFAELKDCFMQEADLYRPDEMRNQPYEDDLMLRMAESSSFPSKQRDAQEMLWPRNNTSVT